MLWSLTMAEAMAMHHFLTHSLPPPPTANQLCPPAALQIRRLRSLGKWPVLVLNADCQPLSYLPLSVMRWQVG